MTIYWDPDVYNYVNEDGEYFTLDEIFELSEQSLDDNSDEISTLASLLIAGLITLSAWKIAMHSAIEREYIRQWLIAVGGVNFLSPDDLQIIGEMLAEQYSYLDGFADDIAAGLLLTVAAIAARAMLYIYSAYGAYWAGRDNRAEKWGAIEEKWVTRQDKEVCQSCLEFEAMGWQPMRTFPIPGTGKTRCLSNCRCFIWYRDTEKQEFI